MSALVALLTHLFGLPDVSAAVVPSSPAVVHAHAYDFRVQLAPRPSDVSERGPPAFDVARAPSIAADPGSHGASARSDSTTIWTYTTHDRSVQLVAVDRNIEGAGPGTTTTSSDVHAVGGESLAVQRAGVAAKTERGLADAAHMCSFSGATLVLMSDGTKKPIEDVRVGDKVLATDPETGEQVAKKVTHLWVHDDTLTDLALADGTVLTTTEDHPYWSIDDQRFERADELAQGERVLAADGRPVAVSGLELSTAHGGLAYNLSVEGIHTYHVGDDELLVHNSCFTALDALNNPKSLEGLTPNQIDDLARNAGFDVLPGKAGASNPATRYYVPGTNGSVGFRVLPRGVAGQTGVKSGPYLKYFGGPLADTYVPLGAP